MSTFKPTTSDYVYITVDGEKLRLLKHEAHGKFTPALLGLGDLKKRSREADTIAAVFDLQGFTIFCKQIEPHLSVPPFLSDFLSWLMAQLKAEMINKSHKDGVELWSDLPFFVKFMGDGLLVLWESSGMGVVEHQNVVLSAYEVCRRYKAEFLPTIKAKFVDPPDALRCGLARGTVYSVGDGNDYVGPCINMSARLQKLPGLTYAFNRRGLDLESGSPAEFFTKEIIVRKVAIRGIGENELIAVLKSEYNALNESDKKLFRAI